MGLNEVAVVVLVVAIFAWGAWGLRAVWRAVEDMDRVDPLN